MPALREADRDPEPALVDRVLSDLTDRAAFVALARHCESVGASDESRSLYRHIVPKSIVEKFGVAARRMVAPEGLRGVRRLGRQPSESVELKEPANADAGRNTVFGCSRTVTDVECVDAIPDARVHYDGRNLLITDRDDVGCATHSTPNGYLMHVAAPRRQRDTLTLRGRTVLLLHHDADNFYHWLYEVLPRIGQLEMAGCAPRDITNFVLAGTCHPFHLQSLEALGVRSDALVFLPEGSVTIECESLLVTNIGNAMGRKHSVRHLSWLRGRLLPLVRDESRNRVQAPRLAIERAERGFADPHAVHAALESKGYTLCKPEKLHFLDQVGLFARAERIVAPHGAALALLAFCSPDTIVHEFYSEHVHPCFWIASNLTCLDYRNYNGSDVSDRSVSASNKNLSQRLTKTIRVDGEWLEAL